MPSKSRKKIKGQARKAKAKAAAATGWNIRYTSADKCHHDGLISNTTSEGLVESFIISLFKPFLSECKSGDNNMVAIDAATRTLNYAHVKFPDVLNNENNRVSARKSIIATGVGKLVDNYSNGKIACCAISLGCAVTVMYIDAYSVSSHTPLGRIDQRDAKTYLRSLDILNGCQRSLVKFFHESIPCNCLDEVYSQLRSTTPKMGKCPGCQQMKDRKSIYVCTGCERVSYCNKACQLAHVPNHKDECKYWQKRKEEIKAENMA